MTTIHITLSINHRGQFERGPCGKVSYIGGEIIEIERVNVDTLNSFFISDLLKDIGYTSITDFYWLEPGKELDNGLRLLRADMDIVKMYEAAARNGNKINVYTENPMDQHVLVEEKNVTPSKMRIKNCAKRIPTPKNSPRRRLIIVKDDDDAKIVGHVQVVKEAQERGEAQPREKAHENNNQVDVEVQNEDSVRLPQHLGDPPHSSSPDARQISQPLPIPVLPDEPPSTQSQPS
ncbi:hypothetical protein S83_067756 [Arachis hypogaea]